MLGPETICTGRLVLRRLIPTDRAEFIRVVRDSRDHLAEFSPLHLPGESDADLTSTVSHA